MKWFMGKSKIYSIKFILFYIVGNIVFGAYVPEFDAITVARNIYIERENLHDKNDFLISYIETITSEGKELIYIIHLNILHKKGVG